jgi:adenylosuccinate synthase
MTKSGSVVVVVGAQWGDEGKGKIVDLYTAHAQVVVRYGGGANAGHTLVVGDRKIVLHLVPSGVLHRGVKCLLGDGMVIDPDVLLSEIAELKAGGYLPGEHDLVVAENAHVILPYHRELDGLREGRAGAIGTTKRGIGPAYEAKAARRGVRVGDLLRKERLRTLIDRNLDELNPLLQRLGGKAFEAAPLLDQALAWGERLRPFVGDASRDLSAAIRAGQSVLFEGAQGTLLDVDHGTYPFVTSSSCVAGGACAGAGVGPTQITAVVGITKAYTTRVGGGPFPTELASTTNADREGLGERIRRVGQEFGATTGRPRRVGWLDVASLRVAVRLNGLSGLAMTKLDVLAGIDPLRVCVGYRVAGKACEELPLDLDEIVAAEPVYEDLPGFEGDLRGARSLAELPVNARRYVERIESLCGCPIALLSVGPERNETIEIHSPFKITRG